MSPWRQSGWTDSGRGRPCLQTCWPRPGGANTLPVLHLRQSKESGLGQENQCASTPPQLFTSMCPCANHTPSLGLRFLYWVLKVDQMTQRILWSLQMRSPVVTPQRG